MQLGDFRICADPATLPPARLVKACAAIALGLHPGFATAGFKSKTQCILCALTVRDFLHDIGFDDACVISGMFLITAWRGEQVRHSLGIGVPNNPHREDGKWNGHLFVALPQTGWLIDPTLYQAARAQWPNLPGMAAVPLASRAFRKIKLPLAGMGVESGDERIEACWYARTDNGRWSSAPDTIYERRAPIVRQLVESMYPMEQHDAA